MKLLIEKPVYGGACLAHQTKGEGSGRAIFVPFTLPGELVEARLVEQKDSFGEASLVRILDASEDRVEPECAHFGSCGGCHYQHAAYAAQVQMKAAILSETLERAGLTKLPAIQPISGQSWAYRNRTRLRIEEIDGHLQIGYSRRGSNEFLAIHECPILAPLLWRFAEALLQVAAEDVTVTRWLRTALEAELFVAHDEATLQMTIFQKTVKNGLAPFCERIQKFIPELTGASTVFAAVGQKQGKLLRQLETWGTEGLIYRAAGEGYWVSRGGFFQINRFLVDELVRIVTGGRYGAIAWDLYAGVGLFSRALAKAFQQVVAVEAAANDLSDSFKGPGRRALRATTVEFLRSAVVQRERPQLIVIDPPRAGLGAEVCALLIRVAAPEIIYVSCDPATLARDLRSLVRAGYDLTELHLVDMFPQTYHLETVAVLHR